jgi:hypothetical protein
MHRHETAQEQRSTYTVVLETVNQLNSTGEHVYHRQGTVVEPAQLRQCKYAAASSKVYKVIGITPTQRLVNWVVGCGQMTNCQFLGISLWTKPQ